MEEINEFLRRCLLTALALLVFVILLLLSSPLIAADTKVSAMTNASALDGTEEHHCVQATNDRACSPDLQVTYMKTKFDTSAELAAILGDETGTGLACFATSPTLTDDATIEKSATHAALTLRNDVAAPAADVEVGRFLFKGNDDGGADSQYARISGFVTDDTAALEDGYLGLFAAVNGTSTKILTVDGSGATVTGTLGATTVTGVNVTSGVDPGHTHTGGGGGTHSVEEWDTTTTTHANSTTETDMYSKSISAMASDELLRVTVLGSYLNNSGASRNLDLSIHLGSTEMWGDDSSAIVAATAEYAFTMQFILGNKGSTGSQIVSGTTSIDRGFVASGAGLGVLTSSTARMNGVFFGTSSEDWTSAKTLAIKADHSAADANLHIKFESVLVERITP